ncbi:MAG: hypothetical protein WC644_01120 [Ignavibacteria bacterium]
MSEQKYWITPAGELIDISSNNIDDHFKYLNDTEEGKKLKNLFNVFNVYGGINKDNLYFVLIKGFIMLVESNATINVTYEVNSFANLVPISEKARNTLLEYSQKDTIQEVQFECCVLDKSTANTLPKKEYVQLFANLINIDHSLIERIINSK